MSYIFMKNDEMLSTLSLICILRAAQPSLCSRRGMNLSGIICKRAGAARTFYYFSLLCKPAYSEISIFGALLLEAVGRRGGGWMAPSLHGGEAARRDFSFILPRFYL